jgi:hypothetical protein
MSKKAVLRDFSALKVEKRIELSAIGVYQLVFRGEQERAFEPRKGTQIYRVYRMNRLDLRQQRSWKKFRDDFDRAQGKSGSVTSSYGEFQDGGDNSERVPVAYTNGAYERIKDIFQRYLGRRERALLYDLLQDDLRSGTELQLEFIGLIRSGYSGEDEARVAGVVHVQTLLDKLGDFYGY